MALLGNPRQTPPGNFVYVQPETQTRMEHETLGELVDLVSKHRLYKGLPSANPDLVSLDIQRQICAAMPPGVCYAEPGEDYKPLNDLSRNLTLEKIESFSLAVFEWVKSGAHFVDEEEAQRRAKICLGCPFNKAPHACSCAPLWAFIKRLIPPRRQIDNLHVCGICGCVNSAAVLAPVNVLVASHKGRDLRWPAHCWQPRD
ncbi:MAG: hypothetical protein KGL39_36125 [Patescibacteria group bacterium]|nr:hypothetical protein [Patescibacteria group bacterium]